MKIRTWLITASVAWIPFAGIALGACGRDADLGGPNGGPGGGSSGSDAGATTTRDGSTMLDGASFGNQDAAPIPLADLCPLYTEDLCIYLTQCDQYPYQDLAQCEAENTCYGVPELALAASQGAVVYDPSKVGQCNALFRSDPCGFATFLFATDIFSVLAYCPGTIAPQLKAGDTCVSSGECPSGLYCNKPNGTCPGTCTAYSAEGGACDVDELFCDQNTICRSNVCVPFASVGTTCASDSDCPNGTCVNGDSGSCANLWCDTTTGKCAAGAGAGEPCGFIDAGSDVACAVNLSCNALYLEGTCVPPGPAGASCSSDLNCQQGLHCDGFMFDQQFGQCAAPSIAGAACNSPTACAAGLFCKYDAQGLNGACAPPSGLGDACTSNNSDCQPGLVCLNTGTVNGIAQPRCVTALYPPASCNDAGTSVCVESLCKNGQCVNTANVGAACSTGTDCTTGACIGGQCADTTVCSNPGDAGP